MKRLFPLLLIAVFPFFTGFSPVHPINGKPYEWLPPDFDPRTGILLIQRVTQDKQEQRNIEKFMKRKYRYKYEFINTNEISDTATTYADKGQYRFVLVYDHAIHVMHENHSDAFPYTMFDFSFVDRRDNKQYLPSGRGASLASIPLKYMINTILKELK